MSEDVKETIVEEAKPTPVYIVGKGECRVGMHPDAPGMVLLAFPKNELCLAFTGEDAVELHDGICMALAMLGFGGEEDAQAGLAPNGGSRRTDN